MVKKVKNSLARSSTIKDRSSGNAISTTQRQQRQHPSQSQLPLEAVDPWSVDLLSLSLPRQLQYHQQGRSTKTAVCRMLKLDVLHPQTVYVARNFLSPTECQAWIDHVHNDQHQPMEYVSHPATRTMAHRECSRWQRNDWTMADRIFQRIQMTIPMQELDFGFVAVSRNSRGSRTTEEAQQEVEQQQQLPIACNGNLRIYKYDKGMRFGRHVDESNETERGTTQVTVLIYLSDCQGGATRFHVSNATTRRTSNGVVFEPQVGAILFHVHGEKCLEHEADPVLGGTKYVLRTDLVYPSKRL